MNYSDIKLLLLDVDGVLTDGSILLDDTGRYIQRFNVKDGMGIKAWRSCGYEVGIITARSGRALTHRAKSLGITLIEQGTSDKLFCYENICKRLGVNDEQVAYMGDDLADLSVLCRVGLPMAPADAAEEIKQVAQIITTQCGGRGAVRQAIEIILKAQGLWDQVLESYGL